MEFSRICFELSIKAVLNQDQTNEIMKKIPMKKLGEPEDVANLALFLSSNSSSYITGQTFHVNGGMLMV